MGKLYPESHIELTPFLAKHYDLLINMLSFGFYRAFMRKAIAYMKISKNDKIMDLGCGTGSNACLMYRYLDGGSVTGIDISDIMEGKFRAKSKDAPGAVFLKQRIDIPFNLGEKFDKIFISFVLHGFPHEVREVIIRNACEHLNAGGSFHILDYSEFDLEKAPVHVRFIFKNVECRYASDYIEKDWKKILRYAGFKSFQTDKLAGGYVRLLTAYKK